MKSSVNSLFLTIVCALCLVSGTALAQIPEGVKTESSELQDGRPLDDIVEKRLTIESRVLPYQPVREADIFYEKRIWRVIDVREKMNQPFAQPELPLFTIIMDGINSGEIRAFSAEDDKFSYQLSPEEVASMLSSADTVITFDPDSYEEIVEVVRNDMDPLDVERYRLKEVWFFDEETSRMNVRILGISPMRNVYDRETGEFRYEQPMFWIYYPECREMFARHQVFNDWNDASPVSWEDLFEMRFFSSYVFQERDIKGRRLDGYLSGVDLLLEAEKIKDEIFNFEQDLWSY
ncbi:MAG: gliding motility protein GldN [Saprospiraceae bacterium]|jgi:gliding motility associated protien GldN